MNQDEILTLYSSLWQNREWRSLEEMIDSVHQEWLDQNTHPRLRKTPDEKFIISIERITGSSLTKLEQRKLVLFLSDLYRQTYFND
ncbi:hypothetical protein [Jeotgalibacillus sp. R-1-5s-1]|uniref:hypothetical protein n=1 Tax=Jeotgalibacillus sp. R-1-5s-1 TaxID=2555897 RepID=UPI00106CC7AA|nr:hypothetical protein [Jeotgalibacillus sp. R-1-5s-1]TFE03284.1 hypothetical protein E2491_00415 [Jeotgalibacillus sp. R-1-5s-1]